MMPALDVETLTTLEELEALRPEWTQLWQRCPSATPFQSPAWLIPWWRRFGGGDLLALALRWRERLVGLVPLFGYEEPAARKLLLLGIGVADYLDALLDPRFADAGTAAILAHLEREARHWDVCDLHGLRPGSPLLEEATPAGWSEERFAQEPCPVLILPARAEDLGHCVPRGMLENLRYCRRRAERSGPVRIEGVRPDNFDELFDALLRLHGARWERRGASGVLADRAVQDFHREAAAALLAPGVLRLYALRIDDRIVASFYGFTAKRRAYYYLSGFDPEFAPLSLGTLVVGHAIEQAVREAAEAFDFLRGGEAYKYRWGAKDGPTYGRKLWRGGAQMPTQPSDPLRDATSPDA